MSNRPSRMRKRKHDRSITIPLGLAIEGTIDQDLKIPESWGEWRFVGTTPNPQKRAVMSTQAFGLGEDVYLVFRAQVTFDSQLVQVLGPFNDETVLDHEERDLMDQNQHLQWEDRRESETKPKKRKTAKTVDTVSIWAVATEMEKGDFLVPLLGNTGDEEKNSASMTLQGDSWHLALNRGEEIIENILEIPADSDVGRRLSTGRPFAVLLGEPEDGDGWSAFLCFEDGTADLDTAIRITQVRHLLARQAMH